MPDQNSPTGALGGFTPTPLPAGGTTSGTPLGVPKGYVAPTVPGYGGLPSHAPGGVPDPGEITTGGPLTDFGTTPSTTQYVAGDEWKVPLTNPQDVPALKQAMLQAGLLTAKTVGNPAVWDHNAATAYAQVLGFANAYGLNATQALAYFQNNPKTVTGSNTSVLGAGVGGQGFNYFFPEYNPANIATGFQATAANLTGSENGQMLPAFTKAFQAAETQAAAGKDIAKIAGSGAAGQYEQKPTPTDFATQYLIQNDPSQVQAYGLASRMNDFFSMLGGGVK